MCERCTESPELYDWLYLGFMAMLPLALHWFFIEWYSGKKRWVLVMMMMPLTIPMMLITVCVRVQLQCSAAAPDGAAGVRGVGRGHAAAHRAAGSSGNPLVPGPDAV